MRNRTKEEFSKITVVVAEKGAFYVRKHNFRITGFKVYEREGRL